MRILFFGDGPWARKSLNKLINTLDITICGVVLRYNNSDMILKEIAEENNIKVYIEKDINSKSFLEFSKGLNLDLCVSMSFDQLIKRELRNVSEFGFINCHAGKLPNYRGRNILNWALINDEKEIGITVHYVDDGIDTGDIISQTIIPISEEDNYRTLLDKAINKCPEILSEAILKIKNGQAMLMKQNYVNGSYFSYRRDGDEFINWDWNSRRIHNFIRALVEPAPGAQTYLDGKKIYIWESEETDFANYISTSGEIIKREKDGITVKTGDNAIKIKVISYTEHGEKFIPNISVGKRFGIDLFKKIVELEEKIKKFDVNRLLND